MYGGAGVGVGNADGGTGLDEAVESVSIRVAEWVCEDAAGVVCGVTGVCDSDSGSAGVCDGWVECDVGRDADGWRVESDGSDV